jgi:predicted nucleotidyltransferase
MIEDVATSDPVLLTFSSILREQLGLCLEHIWLFGSRARGDAREGSDYDMLVIANGDIPQIKHVVHEAAWSCKELHNALVASIVYTSEQWETRKNSPLGWNIQREGKLVA